MQSLAPLCEDDNQAQEIIKKLEKSIAFLSQCTTRVASRAEMLGAINQVTVMLRGVVLPQSVVGSFPKTAFSEHFCAPRGWVAFKPSTRDVEAGGSVGVQTQLGLD